jgi:ABC-type uncharacterized transport system ATPase subunit
MLVIGALVLLSGMLVPLAGRVEVGIAAPAFARRAVDRG